MIPIRLYRQIFGLIILLELLFMTDSIIHVVYEEWEPCYIPLVRDWGLPVTHYTVDLALYIGMAASILFVFDRAAPFRFSACVLVTCYVYLRSIHFYNWNNHYYLNMILLVMFLVLGDMRGREPDVAAYVMFQFFFGTVYFFAGVSKISTAWLNGEITGTMTINYGFWIPNVILSWGGFLLDLVGGAIIIIQCFQPHLFSKPVKWFLHANLLAFHAHNLLYMFSSIQFFPLHMLFTPLVFSEGKDVVRRTPRIQSILIWTLIVGQALFATRRFFLLVDYPWEIMRANDMAEFHSQVHHFSWRMKSRTASSVVSVNGKWPALMSIGLSRSDIPEETQYIRHTNVISAKFYHDPECAVQPLVNRVRKILSNNTVPSSIDPATTVNLYWWAEVNHNVYMLVVNPEFNFVGGDHLPMLMPPPLSQLEAQMFPPDDWEQISTPYAQELSLNGLKQNVPFLVRAIPDIYIPNPVIAAPIEGLHPRAIACVSGKAVIRYYDQSEVICDQDGMVRLPEDGKFHMRFVEETFFLLGFTDV